jgi:hypothetical protein
MPREAPQDHYRLSPDIVGKAKLYVIAAEGSSTEYKYFTALWDVHSTKFNEHNVHVEILQIVPGASHAPYFLVYLPYQRFPLRISCFQTVITAINGAWDAPGARSGKMNNEIIIK